MAIVVNVGHINGSDVSAQIAHGNTREAKPGVGRLIGKGRASDAVGIGTGVTHALDAGASCGIACHLDGCDCGRVSIVDKRDQAVLGTCYDACRSGKGCRERHVALDGQLGIVGRHTTHRGAVVRRDHVAPTSERLVALGRRHAGRDGRAVGHAHAARAVQDATAVERGSVRRDEGRRVRADLPARKERRVAVEGDARVAHA